MLIDLHCHTSPRSSCSRATLEGLVANARARGVDALCITEHDLRWTEEDLAAASKEVGFPLLWGVEVSTDVGHVLAYGELRRPLWRGYRLAELAALPQWSLVHAVEAMSTQTTPEEHALVAAALAVTPRPATAGSDAHDNDKAGAFATRVADHVRTPADLAAEIRAGRVEPVRR